MAKYEYQSITISSKDATDEIITKRMNQESENGWRVISIFPRGKEFLISYHIFFEREVRVNLSDAEVYSRMQG